MSGQRFLFERLAGAQAETFNVRQAVSDQVQRLVTLPPSLGLEGSTVGPHEEPDLLNFGMAPLVDLSFETPVERERHADHLRALIKTFEPRLTDVRVSMTGSLSHTSPLGMEIEAHLDSSDEEEVIRFQLSQSGVKVREGA